MSRSLDLFLTAMAPMIWGSTYIVTTELLPDGYPLTVAMLRALPAGLILLVCVRQLPVGIWWVKVFVLGALNFSIFFVLLFMAAYRLPGGVAATLVATSPLIVIFLAHYFLGTQLRVVTIIVAIAGVMGVAGLTITQQAVLDLTGIIAGLGAALSMAAGTVLTRRWQPHVSLMTFTAWQLTAGGLLLLPASMWLEPALPELVVKNYIGFIYLGLLGGAVTYALWFRGIRRIDTSVVATLGFFSPITAVILGWGLLGQSLGFWQMISITVIMASIWLGQKVKNNEQINVRTNELKTVNQ